MTNLDKRPVYKDKNIEKAFKNALFYYVKYTGDCPICLDFFENPQVLPCGHCYCHSCIVRCIEHSSVCPICSKYFWIFKPVHFFFTQDIGESILFRKCISTDISSSNSDRFYDYPYSLEYFEETDEAVTFNNNKGDTSFNNNKGTASFNNKDTVFINNKTVTFNNKETKVTFNNKTAVFNNNKETIVNEFYQSNDGQLYFLEPETVRKMETRPEYIYAKIRNKTDCFIDWKRYPELSHIPMGTKIVILKI